MPRFTPTRPDTTKLSSCVAVASSSAAWIRYKASVCSLSVRPSVRPAVATNPCVKQSACCVAIGKTQPEASVHFSPTVRQYSGRLSRWQRIRLRPVYTLSINDERQSCTTVPRKSTDIRISELRTKTNDSMWACRTCEWADGYDGMTMASFTFSVISYSCAFPTSSPCTAVELGFKNLSL